MRNKGTELKGLLHDFEAHLNRSGMPRHVRAVMSALRYVFRKAKAKTVEELTVDAVNRVFDGMGRSAGTLNHYRGYLRGFFRWAENTDRIVKSPIRALEHRVGPQVRRRQAQPLDQIAAILEASKQGEPYEYPCTLLGYGAGLRQGEIRRLRWGDIDLAQGTYHFVAERQKGFRDTTTPILPDLLEYLRGLRAARERELGRALRPDELVVPGIPDDPRTLSRHRKATVERAGIAYSGLNGEVCDWHSMRHSFITNLRCEIRIKQELARHASIQTTQGYDHAVIDRQREALAAMPRYLTSAQQNPQPPAPSPPDGQPPGQEHQTP